MTETLSVGDPIPLRRRRLGRGGDTALTDAVLERLLVVPPGLEARVYDAMRYSALAPGKRLRPFLVLAGAQPVRGGAALRPAGRGGDRDGARLFAVHDDLPAMDNSDLRRGRPTCHKQFDEATAVLAGDGLLTIGLRGAGRIRTRMAIRRCAASSSARWPRRPGPPAWSAAR